MDIMDGEVNKIYNKHKNNIQEKIFKMKYPFLKNNNLYSESNHITKEERQKRLSPIIEKQKLILEKIKKDNISRSNISSSNNNDSDNQTKVKINKSNKIFYPSKFNYLNNNNNGNIYSNHNQRNNNLEALLPTNNQNTIQFNNNFNNNILFSNYNNNNNIQRYQNLFNNGSLSSENKSNISSIDKINLNKYNRRKIIYEPYTLIDYKRKYEKMNKKRKLLGGLGANIGGEEWINRQKRLERKKQYSNYVKSDNEEDFKKKKKIKLKLKNENYEITKTISSKKSSEFSNGRFIEPINKKYYIIQTENNIINKNQIKLPLINNKNNIKRVFDKFYFNKKFKIKENFESDKLNPLYQISGNEKDLNELIKQYEEYNGKLN